MRRTTIETVIDGELIFSTDKYVVISGKHPWIFRRDGTFIATLKSIVKAYNMVFLPDNTVIMSSLAQHKVYHVSLETGSILWMVPHKKRSMLVPDTFALAPDGRTVYYTYQSNRVLHIDQIIPQEQVCNTFQIPSARGAILHCWCDPDENLKLLYTAKVDKAATACEDKAFCQDGILSWSSAQQEPLVKYQWFRESSASSHPVACNGEYVLCSDLTGWSFLTGERFDLLENEERTIPALTPFRISNYDSTRKLLTINFLSGRSTIIIDCGNRKVAAHYAVITPGLSGGCLIGDEYWIGTAHGVIKRPFPHMDLFPRVF